MPLTSLSASWLPSTRQPETADLIRAHTYLEHSLVLKDLQAAFPKVCSLEHGLLRLSQEGGSMIK